ncbi:agmatinase family protein [Roseivirga misakiensis]|uniref:Agmatinase n=1 Tax=Roseivirga misakiensis TaxID=1563681 RepID=A0A1E5SZA0_9BACT|nr:agmatinase family protein [Roseivirga misakiensis]OEK04435.1 agmatinase [Roseivirga misakiensis]
MSIMDGFDPNGVGVKGSLFGLPFTTENAKVIIIPVPWDVTASYGGGAANAPQAILDASSQIDYEIPDIPDAWKIGVAMAEIPEVWYSLAKELRPKAEKFIDWLEHGSDATQRQEMQEILTEINRESKQLMTYVEQESRYWHEQGKTTILLGGDHSTPLGHIKACADREGQMGILQIDAHADLRNAYEGFTYSHASIMHNVLLKDSITHLVQVGVRDYCIEESQAVKASEGRVRVFYDQHLKTAEYEGVSWAKQCQEIVDCLPQQVYISFDIDGLDPKLCPNTGTPVPGGFELEQINYLFRCIIKSGRNIVGADLTEVSPSSNEWDANVGARALYQLSCLIGNA